MNAAADTAPTDYRVADLGLDPRSWSLGPDFPRTSVGNSAQVAVVVAKHYRPHCQRCQAPVYRLVPVPADKGCRCHGVVAVP